MTPRARDILTVAGLVAVLLAAFVALRLFRPVAGGPVAAPPSVPERPAAASGEASGEPAARERPSAGGAVSDGGVSRRDASGGPDGLVPPAGRQETAQAASWKPRAPADFKAEDVAQCGQGVLIDLGNYEPSAGEEFEVGLRLTGPALESLTLRLRYDKDHLVLVPGSVHPVGPQFRSGIECYAGRDGGTMVLIHTGEPGKRNLDAGSGEVAVVWRMRAVQAGSTRVEVSERSSFTSAQGEDETFRVVGGEVSVR